MTEAADRLTFADITRGRGIAATASSTRERDEHDVFAHEAVKATLEQRFDGGVDPTENRCGDLHGNLPFAVGGLFRDHAQHSIG